MPPYHIAGVANLVSNVYSGRRIVYLFLRSTPEAWLGTVREEQITQGMVVPTMLARIVESARRHTRGQPMPPSPPSFLPSYGGSPMPRRSSTRPRALPRDRVRERLRPHRDQSTIALLGPDDHRAASPPRTRGSGPASAGRAACCRGSSSRYGTRAAPPPPGGTRPLYLRGEQISGEYAGVQPPGRRRGLVPHPRPVRLTPRATCSWRAAQTTRSSAAARTSPRPRSKPCSSPSKGLADVVVVGLPDDEWGQRLVGVVVRGGGYGGVEEDELPRPCPCPAAIVQDARAHRVLGRAAAHRHRQAAAPGPVVARLAD